jgi:putative RecB family exonuclease
MSAARSFAMVEAQGGVLSPSSANQYLNCSAKWRYRHIDRLPDPKTGALLQGSCVHKAVETNFRDKLETGRDLPLAGIRALYREAWAKLAPETEFRDDEDAGELAAQGEALTVKFVDEAAPSIEPAAVELAVRGNIGGVPVRGYIDLLDVHGRIIDLKTAAKRPSGIPPDHRFQIATYRLLLPQASGEATLFTLTKTKTPQVVPDPFTVEPHDLVQVERMYPVVQSAIRAGVFVPNRSSHMCSRKYCAFWRSCQREFGGEVSG